MSDHYEPDRETVRLSVEAFHQALDAEGVRQGRNLGHGREGEWVDENPETVVEALLRAGWEPVPPAIS